MAFRVVEQPEYSVEELKARVDLRVLVAPGAAIRGDKPVKIRCLWHDENDPSLTIWPDRMFCFGCRESMDLIDFVAWREQIDGDDYSFDRVLEVVASKYVGLVPAPPPSRPIVRQAVRVMPTNVADYLHKQLNHSRRAWLYSRGLTDETIDREKLGYEGHAFAIPVWSESGELLTVRYRRDDDALGDRVETYSKYWGIKGRNDPMLYNVRAFKLVEEWGWIVICEGELDAIRLYQEGLPAVSATNGANALDENLAEQIKKIKPAKIILAYDQDEGGRINGIRVARMFGRRGRVMRWPPSMGKDVTEYLKKASVEDFVLLALDADLPVQVESYWQKTLRNGVWR